MSAPQDPNPSGTAAASPTPRCEICGSRDTRFLRDKYICLGCGHVPS